MTRPSPRKVGKALPALIVEMRWQDGRWWWCDVRLRSGPKFPPLSAYHRSIGYTRVKYVPSLPRKAGTRGEGEVGAHAMDVAERCYYAIKGGAPYRDSIRAMAAIIEAERPLPEAREGGRSVP